MDGLKLLEEDHRKVEKLFAQFEEAGDRAHKTKRDICAKVVQELRAHSEMEEKVLYPAAREEVEGTEDVVLESFEEHHVVEQLLDELDGMDPQDEQFEPKFTVLMESVRHHVEEEEKELFPKLRRALGDDRLEELGQRMQEIKRRHQRAA